MAGSVVAGALMAAAVTLLSAGITGSVTAGESTDAETHLANQAPLAAPAALAADPAPAAAPDAPAPGVVPQPGSVPAAGAPAALPPGAAPAAAPQPAAKPAAPQPAAAPPATAPRMIMIIRHGEKPGDTPGEGIDPAGQPDDHSLTSRGWSRAKSLPQLFNPTTTKAGLAVPKTIYAASATGKGSGQRTRETVMPLGSRLGVPVNTSYGKGQEAALMKAATAQAQKGPVLVSWQHGEIPLIAEQLKVVGPQPPKSWPDSRYDVVWTFTETPQGWKFAQVPQQLLNGDAASTIR